jgi:hypothetical protein
VNDKTAALVEVITKKFADEGKLIEGGWQVMRAVVVPPTASAVQLDEMRKAYFSGAQQLFASIMSLLGDESGEPTPDDLRRMELIQKELDGFVEEMRREVERRR